MPNSKLDITRAFISTVERKGLSGVRVTELVEELGLNRKTFYYHFDSKYELAMRIFLLDLGKDLRENFPGRDIVTIDTIAGKKQEEPYAAYVRIEERHVPTTPASSSKRLRGPFSSENAFTHSSSARKK